MKRRENLADPRYRRKLNVSYEAGAFGRFSEGVARNLGTARFLVVQTFLVIIWIAINVLSIALRWDPYPFILLNLMFSVQAAYAAPLILLAQNRQEDRDSHALENDRAIATRTQENAEYLARELAAVRLVLSNTVTTSELQNSLDALSERLEQLLAAHAVAPTPSAPPAPLPR
jgi:Predicted membrane protein